MTTAPSPPRLRIGPGISFEAPSGTVTFTEFQRALLLLVADAGGSGISRDRIAALLWDGGEGSETSPRRRLRQLIYGLNRRAGVDLLQGDAERLLLSPQVEVTWFGGSLAEQIPAPTRAYQVVQDEIEERAAQRSHADAVSVVDAARLADDPERILQVLAQDPDAESLWRHGVWALLRSGQVREAEEVLRGLGIEDDGVLRKCRGVLDRVLAGELSTPDHADASALIGRTPELAAVTRAIETDQTRVALVGPNGIGLTRLLGAASAWALTETDDLVIASTRCTATGRSVPYDTLNRLFDSDLFRAAYAEMEEPWKSVVARVLVRAIGDEPSVEIPRLEGTSATLRVLHGIAGLIEKAVGRAQLLAVIDDLHNADAASLTVLIHLGYEGDGPILRMLTSVRDDTDASSPIEGFLRKEALVVRVGALGPEDSAELVQDLHPEISDEDALALASLCDGVPRRLVEASRSVSEAGGSLARETLDELLARRMDQLTVNEQEVLALLSVQPGGADAELLLESCEIGTLQLAQAIGELGRRGLVREDQDLVHITSAFLRQRVAEGIPPVIRRALHLRIARQLESRTPVPAAQVGSHLLEAGLGEEAASRLIEGAHQASDDEAFPVAIELMRRAREASLEELAAEEFDFWGEILEAEGLFGEAAEIYPLAEAGWTERGEEEKALWSRLGWLRAGVEIWEQWSSGEAVREVLLESRSLGLSDLEALAIDLLLRIADGELNEPMVWRALSELEAARAAGNRSPLLDWVTVRRVYIDDPDGAKSAALKFYRSTTPETPDRLAALNRMLNQGVVRGVDGDDDVREAARELRDFNSRCDPLQLLSLHLNLGTWHLERGELDAAAAELEKSLEFVRVLPGAPGTNLLVNLAEVAVLRGDMGKADALMQALGKLGRRSPRDMMLSASIEALIALESGDFDTARARELEFSTFSFSQPLSCFPMTVLKARVGVLESLGLTEQAQEEVQEALARAQKLFPRMISQVTQLARAELV